MDNSAEQNAELHDHRPFMQTPVACVLATIGFACLASWWTYIVFAPVTPLLSFAPTQIGVYCSLLSHLFALVGLFVCIKRAQSIFTNLKRFVVPGSIFFYIPAFAMAILMWANIIPLHKPALYASWMAFGLGELFLSLTWIILFSFMSAKWVALSIAVGGALSPPLVILILNVHDPFVGLGGISFVLIVSIILAKYCFSKVSTESLQTMKSYDHKPNIQLKGAVSVGVRGFAYGFVVIMLCSLGLSAVLVACTMAIMGSLLSILWAYRRIKQKWNLTTVQRMTVPLLIMVLLFIPFLGSSGRAILGGVAIAIFAYTKLMEWTELVVMNTEFQLFPVKRYAIGQFTLWTGFIIGAVGSLYAFFINPLSSTSLSIVCCVIATAIVAAYSWHMGEREDELIKDTTPILVPVVEVGKDKNSAECASDNTTPFRDQCDMLIKQYGLTSREAEVFICLAKGRNAEYVQQKLYISNNTARTHIRHIYQKMEITSQQQLIDLVDNRQA